MGGMQSVPNVRDKELCCVQNGKELVKLHREKSGGHEGSREEIPVRKDTEGIVDFLFGLKSLWKRD